MQIIDRILLDRLSAEAAESPRLRKNHNFHLTYDEPCQRLLNALEPGTYIRPHRHLTPPKPETFVAIRGRMAALLFDDEGRIIRTIPFGTSGDAMGCDISAGAWHSVVCLGPASVFFETKPGPYEPLSDKDWAPWAPEEASAEAAEYLKGLEEAVHKAILNSKF